MKQFKRLLIIFVVFYLIALVFVYVKQRSFIYFPENTAPPDEFVSAFDLEVVEIEVDGVGGVQSYYKAPETGGPLILFFHGNGGSVYHRAALLSLFKTWGAGYLAVEYPGYAGNPGKPTEKTILDSALSHYDWLIVNGVLSGQIVIYGHSLGAASAVHVAAECDAASLVLSAPFLSATSMGRHRMPFFPAGLLLKDKFRSDLKMAFVDEPLVVIHGSIDRIIPHYMGKMLSERHSGDNTFVTMEGVGHAMFPTQMDRYLKDALFRYALQTEP